MRCKHETITVNMLVSQEIEIDRYHLRGGVAYLSDFDRREDLSYQLLTVKCRKCGKEFKVKDCNFDRDY